LILYPRAEEQVEELPDQIGKILKDRGITLKELLKGSEQMRLEVVKERYAEVAQEYGL